MKSARKILLALAIITILGACQKTEIALEESTSHRDGKITMTITASQSEESKTVIKHEGTNYVPYWTAGDRIRVLELIYSKFESPTEYPNEWYNSEENATESQTAAFDITISAREKEENEQYHYLAVYPVISDYEFAFRDFKWTGYDEDWVDRWSEMAPDLDRSYLESLDPHPTAIVEIPIDQSPSEDCFDPSADVLVSDMVNTDIQPTSLNMKFARVGTIVKMDLTGLPSGFIPESGELKCDESWPAAYLMEFDPILKRIGVYEKPSNWIRFNFDNFGDGKSQFICDGSDVTIWLRTISGTLKNWFTVNIYGTLDEEQVVFKKEVALTKDLIFPEGKATKFSVALQQGYIFNYNSGIASIGENAYSNSIQYMVSGPSITTIEYGIYYTKGEYYEEHDENWTKVVLTPDGDGNATIDLNSLDDDTYYTIAPYVIINGEIYWASYNTVFQTLKHYSYTTPDAVDLGLSVKWASFNLGATKQSEYGYLYSWAETRPREACAGYDYKWYNSGSYTKYTEEGGGTMETTDDAARVNLGDEWRLPTKDEWLELKDNCTWTDDTVEGVDGKRATSTKNGNSIFFPFAGYAGSSYSYYANKEYVGTRTGIMFSTYQSGNKCQFGIVPISVDYDYCTMMSSLFSVRAVK